MLEDLTPPVNKSVYCKVADIMETLEQADQKILEAALAREDVWKAKTLSVELRKRGISMADTTITKHRRRVCACYRGNN